MAAWALMVLALVAGCSGADVATPTSVDVGVVASVPPVVTTAPARTPEQLPAPSPVEIPAPTAVVVPAPTTPGPETPATVEAATVEAATTAPTAITPESTVVAESSVVPPAATAVPTVAPVVSDSSSQEVLVANGAEVYTLNCARCHGENGLGTAQYSGVFGVGNKYTTAGMIDELTNGHPVTFGFADRLSADEIASVVAYVKATFP